MGAPRAVSRLGLPVRGRSRLSNMARASAWRLCTLWQQAAACKPRCEGTRRPDPHSNDADEGVCAVYRGTAGHEDQQQHHAIHRWRERRDQQQHHAIHRWRERRARRGRRVRRLYWEPEPDVGPDVDTRHDVHGRHRDERDRRIVLGPAHTSANDVPANDVPASDVPASCVAARLAAAAAGVLDIVCTSFSFASNMQNRE